MKPAAPNKPPDETGHSGNDEKPSDYPPPTRGIFSENGTRKEDGRTPRDNKAQNLVLSEIILNFT
jgi:hypothetical protein